jgi:hypothetical protein
MYSDNINLLPSSLGHDLRLFFFLQEILLNGIIGVTFLRNIMPSKIMAKKDGILLAKPSVPFRT